MPTTTPYGSWKSPLSPQKIAAASMRLRETLFDGDTLYWIEQRANEGGRNVIVRCDAGGMPEDVTPAPFSARTTVYEYGGGGLTVSKGVVYFSNFADQRIYRREPGKTPVPITPEGKLRFSDWTHDPRNENLVAVMEDHSAPGEPVLRLAVIDAHGKGSPRVIVEGADFYASPRVSPDGKRIAWVQWNHPEMPWDGSELKVGAWRGDGVADVKAIAGSRTESIQQPLWSPDGKLCFVSDRNGWWNLYEWNGEKVRCLLAKEAEFGLASWSLRQAQYAFIDDKTLAVAFAERGFWSLGVLDRERGILDEVSLGFTEYKYLTAAKGRVGFVAGGWNESSSVNVFSVRDRKNVSVRRTYQVGFDERFLSRPQPIFFPSANGTTAHAFYYPPTNPDFAAPAGEKPPVFVVSHGGPTSAAEATLWLGTQFWTSRGFAVVDVNYRGSTGYGRAYRDALLGNWGIADVEDCIHAAKHLVAQGLADAKRLSIRGGSAGGYTTLCGLTFHKFFSAGTCYFGVSDIEMLTRDTHKFESRYFEKLVGPSPQTRRERSPIHYVDQISCPLILFQGLEDKIVPPNQSETMANSLRARWLPVAYLAFAGEQHGFRKTETVLKCLHAELFYYAQLFHFDPADVVEAIEIENYTPRPLRRP